MLLFRSDYLLELFLMVELLTLSFLGYKTIKNARKYLLCLSDLERWFYVKPIGCEPLFFAL